MKKILVLSLITFFVSANTSFALNCNNNLDCTGDAAANWRSDNCSSTSADPICNGGQCNCGAG